MKANHISSSHCLSKQQTVQWNNGRVLAEERTAAFSSLYIKMCTNLYKNDKCYLNLGYNYNERHQKGVSHTKHDVQKLGFLWKKKKS